MFGIRQFRYHQPMKTFGLPAILLLTVIIQSRFTSADVVWIQGEDNPRYGRVVSANERQIVFWPFGEPESSVETFDRESVEALVTNYDRRRLEALSPVNYPGYRDYAEELAAQKSDPIARELAIRLYIIAAAGSKDNVRQSSLKGLVGLAENERQRKRWNSLLQLYQTEEESQKTTSELPDSILSNERKTALKVVRSIRQGNGAAASELLEQSSTRMAMRHWRHICGVDELKRLSRLNRPKLSQLHQLLRIELSVLNKESTSQINEDSHKGSWGEYAQAESNLTAAIPSFLTATKFDPRKSIFRDGRWIRPN